MKTYWRGTSIRVSKFRLWVASLVIPKTVWKSWDRQTETLREQEKEAHRQYLTAFEALNRKESRHEQDWLKQASAFSGVDLSDRASEYRGEAFNSALICAKEAYRRGLGYRDFLGFYNEYRGIGRPNPGGVF